MTTHVLTNTGDIAIVDDDVDDWVKKKVWTVTNGHVKCSKDNKTVQLHRYVIGAAKGQIVDHINGDPLDCRRSNLRICSHVHNSWNQKCSGVTCVSGYWQVAIRQNGVNKYLGRYKNI